VKEFRARNVLITGGAGFIGSNFVRHFQAASPGARLVNLDLLTYAGSLENLRGLPDESGHRFVHGDICDRELVERIMKEEDIDTVVHFAADSHVDRSTTGPEPFIQTNIVGTYTLLEAARSRWRDRFGLSAEQCRFHHISTDEVYGALGPDDLAFCETTPYRPSSPYSASKAASDHLVMAYFRTFGLPVTISNCSNNYGPRQHIEKFIPTVVHACLDGKQIPLYGDGTNIRDWLYVEDHCASIMAVLRRGRVGESYVIGGRNQWSNIDLARQICDFFDREHPASTPHAELIALVTDRPGHDWRYAIDDRKIERELAWRPAESFPSGLAKTIRWYVARH